VLFSDNSISKFLNDNFECAWQSVRPVPTLTLDLGNGKIIKRTMHGNVATYVCTSDGVVVDILPGMYDANDYLSSLQGLKDSALSLRHSRNLRDDLAMYHQGAFQQLSASAHVPKRPTGIYPERYIPVPEPVAKAGLKELLTLDTEINQVERRSMIHKRLANSGPVRPNQIKHWLYRDVLHADLDDPYLGLGSLLSANNPFGH
jgi:hypothetical protein